VAHECLYYPVEHSAEFAKYVFSCAWISALQEEKYGFFLITLKICKPFFLLKYLAKILHVGTVYKF